MIGRNMAHSLQREQQKRKVLSGMYVWKIERALENIDELNSPVFKFGRNDGFLKFRYDVSSADGRESRILKIDLYTVASFENIENIEYIESCFISTNGDTYLHSLSVILPSRSRKYWTYSDILDDELGDFNKLSAEKTLTFCVGWGEDNLRSMIQQKQKTPSDQTKGTISTKSTEKLLKDLKTFYESKTNTDCVLKVSGKEFEVHRALLCARSPVFAAMFRHNTSESQSGVVEISDVDAVALKNVLHYIYTGEILGLTPETAASMFAAADKYALMEMREDCLGFLKFNLTIENIGDVIQLAYLHEPELNKYVIVFIKDNSEELQENDNWREFLKNNPFLVIKYLHFALNAASKPKDKKQALRVIHRN